MGGFSLNLNTTGMGLGTGIDVQSTVNSLMTAARATEQVWIQQQQLYSDQTSALNNINSLLGNLQTAAEALNDPLGALAAHTTSSSDSSIVTASASATASLGSHTVVVSGLATTSSAYTVSLGSGATLSGSFTIQVGSNQAQTVTIGSSNNTLSSLASYINNNSQTYGVTATVIMDANGSRLALASKTSGAPGNLQIIDNTTGKVFTDPIKGLNVVAGVNASLTVDNVPISSTSNTVTGAINGVTLALAGMSDQPVTISVNPDTTQTASAINNFVSAYNAVTQAINTQFTYTQGASSQPPLLSDASLAQVQQVLGTDVNHTISGNNGINSLAAIGVNVQQDGTLSVDNGTLNAALTNNFGAVQNLFQRLGSQSGFAVQLSNDLTNLTDPTRGALYTDLQGVSQSQTEVTDEINAFEANLAVQQQLWTQEYSQVNATLQSLPNDMAQITAQLSGLGVSLSTTNIG